HHPRRQQRQRLPLGDVVADPASQAGLHNAAELSYGRNRDLTAGFCDAAFQGFDARRTALAAGRLLRIGRLPDIAPLRRPRPAPTDVVRGDLHFDRTAFRTPSGDLATYILDLADSDPDALSSSLALQVEKEYRRDSKGRAQVDEDGEELPPLWRTKKIHASD